MSPLHLTSFKQESHINFLFLQDYYIDQLVNEEEAEIENNAMDVIPEYHYVFEIRTKSAV